MLYNQIPVIAGFVVLIAIFFLVLLNPIYLFLGLSFNEMVLKGWYRVEWNHITLRSGDLFSLSSGLKDVKKRMGIDEFTREWHEAKQSTDFQSVARALPSMIRIAQNIAKSIHLVKFFCVLRLGLQDPAETAVIIGCLWSIVSSLNLSQTNISIEPVFQGEMLDGCLEVNAESKVLTLILAILSGLKEKEIRKLLTMIIRGF